MFNEGYVATSGPDWARPALCHEAIRLARLLASLLPAEREVLALDALLDAPGLPAVRPRRRLWSGDPAARPGPAALGPAAGPAGHDGAVAGPGASRAAHAVPAPGVGRGVSRARAVGRGDRLAADRPAVRGARRRLSVTGRRAEPGRRGGHGRRPAGRDGTRRRRGRRALTARLRQVPAVRAHLLGLLNRARGGSRGVPARGRPQPERARGGAAATAGRPELGADRQLTEGACSVGPERGLTRQDGPVATSRAPSAPLSSSRATGLATGSSRAFANAVGSWTSRASQSTRRWRRVRLARPARTGLMPRTATKSVTRMATKLRWPGPPRPGPNANPNRTTSSTADHGTTRPPVWIPADDSTTSRCSRR